VSNIRFLRTFIAVARYGSFAAAAEKVALTQAAVSMQMQALEAELRQSLFDRSGRIVKLSHTGRSILARAEQLVELYDGMRALGSTSDEIVGSVTVGAVVSVMGALASAVVAMKALHPRLDVRLISARSIELAAQIETGEIDAAVVVEGQSKLTTSSLWSPLYDEPLVLITSQRDPLIDAAELVTKRPFLRFDRSQRTGAVIERALRKNQFLPNEFLELNSLEAIVELIRQDVGVAVVPLLRLSSWANDPSLRIIRLRDDTPVRSVGMLERRGHERQPVTSIIRERVCSDLTT
jgi:DNA-binding transcriptional LysR family regulator